MNVKVLKYFIVVADTKNITKAASILCISQPTLSRQLILLENQLGISLFVKNSKGIELTEQGHLFKQRAREILDLVDLTYHEFNNNSVVTGNVSLGYIDSVGKTDFLKCIHDFKDAYPFITFELFMSSSDDIVQKMNAGIIDISFLNGFDTSQYNIIRLPDSIDKWGVLIKHSHPFAVKPSIFVSDLIHEPLFIPQGLSLKNEIENWFGKNKYHLNIFSTYNILSGVYDLLKITSHPAICLDSDIIKDFSGFQFKEISPVKTAQTSILWRKNRSFNMATQLFLSHLMKRFNNIEYNNNG
ncbi:LysR family transcriptional regulator [Klebsiella oxytoca]|uniref:LysR family transcriptional regulator n=1 Tax=Klebsiella oxytoca TaxID=571 RepID=UPI001092EBA1|nr:LysR family transcriptional regulator [Klebsiella oxytoca]TGN40786.1 LysR family transcriptional regulator [Klebsiella oxytoca]